MRKSSLYIETSVWSHYYADDAPDKRDVTRRFFDYCHSSGLYELYVSTFVLREFNDASTEVADRLVKLLDRFGPTILTPVQADAALSEAYAACSAIPRRKQADRMHAAVATTNQLDFLVSWNYRDFVNVIRREKLRSVNLVMGYRKPLEMVTPLEVLGDEI